MSWNSRIQSLLGACTSPAAFGEDLIHSPQSGPEQTLKGIWSDTYISIEPESGIQIMGSDPNAGFRLTDFTTPPRKNDTITRGSVDYTVRAVEPDGEGGTTLVLEKVKT